MKESETAHKDGPDSRYATLFTIESEGGKSDVFYNCQEPPGKYGEQDRDELLNQSVSFPDWKLILSGSNLPAKEKESFKITINWFLSFCKRARSRATRRAANAFYETVRRERDPKPFQLVQWKNALAWFFRNAPESPIDGETIPAEQVHAERSRQQGEAWLDRFIGEIRRRHYSYHTEVSYLQWIRSFDQFTDGDLTELGKNEVREYLDHLAVEKRIGSSTQRQALNALVFFYEQALGKVLGDFSDFLRARPKANTPTVLTAEELESLFSKMTRPYRTMAQLQYGSGLRVSELCSLRVKDLDFGNGKVIVRRGKGGKDRATPLPQSLRGTLKSHLGEIRIFHENDRSSNAPGVYLPEALERKFSKAGKEWNWFWVWPGRALSVDPRSKTRRRHHIVPRYYQSKISQAAKAAEIPKRVTSHVLRHSFGTHLLEAGIDLRTLQDLMGHADIKTTQGYLHVMRSKADAVRSPLDLPEQPPRD